LGVVEVEVVVMVAALAVAPRTAGDEGSIDDEEGVLAGAEAGLRALDGVRTCCFCCCTRCDDDEDGMEEGVGAGRAPPREATSTVRVLTGTGRELAEALGVEDDDGADVEACINRVVDQGSADEPTIARFRRHFCAVHETPTDHLEEVHHETPSPLTVFEVCLGGFQWPHKPWASPA
jgi:hypothetical protein